jgi:hypothetical protein
MERFLTVDELARDLEGLATIYPELTRYRRVGTSRLGEPIHLLSIGEGSRDAFLFACPHPNEPIGAMMVNYFSRLLCEDDELRSALDFTWHVIPCIDPDGTRLNEGWFAGPFTPRNYARHFYRPAPDQQVEWTFPVSYKQLYFDATLPETEALMRVIDEVQPELLYSLHNAGFGGVYYYMSRPDEGLYATFHQLPEWEGLMLDLGEPEVPWATVYAPAIYAMPPVTESYDFIEQFGGDPAAMLSGASSGDYSQKYGTLTLVVEMPYYDDPRSNDRSATATQRRDAIFGGLALQREQLGFLKQQYDSVVGDLRSDSPFRTTIEATIRRGTESLDTMERWATESEETARPATVAECFSNDQMIQFYRLLAVGELMRLLEGEIGIGNGTPAIRSALRAAQETFDRWATQFEATTPANPIPIRKLVAVQFGAALATAAFLQER